MKVGDEGKLTYRALKVDPPGESNSMQDCLDEIYEVLYRRGYALAQGSYGVQTMFVLCKQHEPGKFEAVAQVAQIVPDYGQRTAAGIDWRPVRGSSRPAPAVSEGIVRPPKAS